MRILQAPPLPVDHGRSQLGKGWFNCELCCGRLYHSWRLQAAIHQDQLSGGGGFGFGGFVGGMDDDLAFFAEADAFGADAGHIFESEMDDAAFARRHGIEAKRLTRQFDALSGDLGGHAQLFEAQGAVTAAIDVNFFMEGRLEAQSAKSEMLDGFEDFGVALEKNVLVAAIEVGDDFREAFFNRSIGGDSADIDFEVESGGANAFGEKFLESSGSGDAIKFTVKNVVGNHGHSGAVVLRSCIVAFIL
jgi:hypothetical protein